MATAAVAVVTAIAGTSIATATVDGNREGNLAAADPSQPTEGIRTDDTGNRSGGLVRTIGRWRGRCSRRQPDRVAVIDPPAASVETVPVSRVAAAVDVVVVVAAVVVVAREKARRARRATAVPKVAAESASTRSQRSVVRDKVIVAASKWPTVTIITMSTAKAGTPVTSMQGQEQHAHDEHAHGAR